MGRAGKMAEVQGGRNLRPPEIRKARHNKVYTAKGPRDRRVRLSANTAIQFYDVQDRLGFERASEAVDWLIKKAKSSIDKLFDISSQNPEAQSNANVECHRDISMLEIREEEFNLGSENSVHISEYNSVENSLLFPYFHAGNCSGELGSCYNQQGFVECSGIFDRVQRSGVSSDDEIVKFYISSSQEHGNQEEQNVGFKQQAFLMQASLLE